jgi:hypothetical protein
MAMEYAEGELRRQGKEDVADRIASVRKLNGGDVDLPFSAEPETRLTTPETSVEIKRFSDEQKEALMEKGYKIYLLTGQSVKTLRDSGHKFKLDGHEPDPELEALVSMHSEVAVNPDNLFLSGSSKKTLGQQEEMVDEFSQELAKKVQGVKAIIGQVPDYLELTLTHLDAAQEYLFGVKDNYNYTRTKTSISDSRVAVVGAFSVRGGLRVRGSDSIDIREAVRVAPLVVPV